MLKHISNKDEFISNTANGTVLVDFFANWCGPCKMLAPVLEKLADEMPEIDILKIDVDAVADVAKDYGIMSIPTLILFILFLETDKQVGYMNLDQLKSFVK